MNDPRRIDELERRIQKLEHDQTDIVESEKLLLKLAKYHRAGLQELNGKVERLELLQGDTNERLDHIEQTGKRNDKHFESIEHTQEIHTEVLGQIVNLSESHTKRFDRIEATQAEHTEQLKALRQDIADLKPLMLQIVNQQRPSE